MKKTRTARRGLVWSYGAGCTAAVLAAVVACGGNTTSGGPDAGSGGRTPSDDPAAGEAGHATDGSGGRPTRGGAENRGGAPSSAGGPPNGAVGGGVGIGGNPGTGGTLSGSGASSATGGVWQGGSGTEPPDRTLLLRVQPNEPAKVDLLLMVDNSVGMPEKQALLAQSLPRLLSGLIAPRCLDEDGEPTGVVDEGGTCARGVPEFTPIRDLHVGVITSSLGDMGSGDTCTPGAPEKDDRAWLAGITRDRLPSWDDRGFLSWDPDARQAPPGTSSVDALTEQVLEHVRAVGTSGCGYEASLEAWYRFLVDPEPPEEVVRDANVSVAQGPSETLLEQRAAFLRPDSLVAVVMVTDENDCSILDHGQGWIVGLQAQGTFHMPRATSACETDPNSPCCFSCSTPASGVPAGCTPPTDDRECQRGILSLEDDHPNLRCYQQKRRFGFDLLQPLGKYLQALTEPEIFHPREPDRNRDGQVDADDLMPNPLYAAPGGLPMRDRSMVFLTGIVGVPWQDVSDERSWEGDELRYLGYDELEAQGRWDWITGSQPADSLMFETPIDRTTLAGLAQVHPAGEDVGGRLQSAASTDQLANPINGHESASGGFQLQSACLMPLLEPLDCSRLEGACDCRPEEAQFNWATCDGTTQTHTAATPATRQLELLRGFGEATGNAVVGSICAKSVSDEPDASAFGYNAAFDALVERMKPSLHDRCLGVELESDEQGRVECALLELTPGDDGACRPCADLPGRVEPTIAMESVRARLGDDACICEVEQYTGAALEACRGELSDPSEEGFCYVDAAPMPDEPADSEALAARRALVASCPSSAKRILRVGGELPAPGSTLFFACPDATR